jgi:hypothetical protein
MVRWLVWGALPCPRRSRWDREFESPLLQERVTCELGSRGVGVDAHLIDVAGAVIPAAQRAHERRRIHDLGLLRRDQVPTAGELRQSGVLRHRCAYGRALSQVVVGIDVDDLIERTELGLVGTVRTFSTAKPWFLAACLSNANFG